MMIIQLVRFILATLANFAVFLIAYDLIQNPKYGFGIFLIFGFFIPIRIIMILTASNVNWSKKLLFLSSSTTIVFLSLYWSRYNEDWLLMFILGIAAIDSLVDLNSVVKTVKELKR
jgi:NADH:ubiquinone oxidoreductase subunit K